MSCERALGSAMNLQRIIDPKNKEEVGGPLQLDNRRCGVDSDAVAVMATRPSSPSSRRSSQPGRCILGWLEESQLSTIEVANGHRLYMLIFSETILAPLDAQPTLLDAAKGVLSTTDEHSVDTHHAALKSGGDPHDASDVPGIKVSSQTELGVVGQLQRLLFCREREYGRYRSKDLVAGDVHVDGRSCEDRGFEEEAIPFGRFAACM